MSLAGYSPWGRKQSDMTERLNDIKDSSFGRGTLPGVLWQLKQEFGDARNSLLGPLGGGQEGLHGEDCQPS